MAIGPGQDDLYQLALREEQRRRQAAAAAQQQAPQPQQAIGPRDALEAYRRLKDQGYDDGEIEAAFAQRGIPMPPTGIMGEFARGLQRGGLSSLGSASTGIGGLIPGQDRFDAAGAELQEAAQDPSLSPGVGAFEDVRGVGDVPRYLAGLVGQTVPESAGIAAIGLGAAGAGAGVVGAGVAAGVASFLPNLGRNLEEQLERGADPEDIAPGTAGFTRAFGAAVGQSALDSVLTSRLASLVVGGRLAAAKVPLYKRVLREAALGGLIEAPTEATQEALQILQADPDIANLVGPEGRNRLVEAAIGGGLVGGVLGAAGAPFDRADGAATPPVATPEQSDPLAEDRATLEGELGIEAAGMRPETLMRGAERLRARREEEATRPYETPLPSYEEELGEGFMDRGTPRQRARKMRQVDQRQVRGLEAQVDQRRAEPPPMELRQRAPAPRQELEALQNTASILQGGLQDALATGDTARALQIDRDLEELKGRMTRLTGAIVPDRSPAGRGVEAGVSFQQQIRPIEQRLQRLESVRQQQEEQGNAEQVQRLDGEIAQERQRLAQAYRRAGITQRPQAEPVPQAPVPEAAPFAVGSPEQAGAAPSSPASAPMQAAQRAGIQQPEPGAGMPPPATAKGQAQVDARMRDQVASGAGDRPFAGTPRPMSQLQPELAQAYADMRAVEQEAAQAQGLERMEVQPRLVAAQQRLAQLEDEVAAARVFEQQAGQRTQEADAARAQAVEDLLRTWERARQQDSAGWQQREQEGAAAEEAFSRAKRDIGKQPGRKGKDGRFPISAERFLADDKGRPVLFDSAKAAARWLVKNEQTPYWDIVPIKNRPQVWLRANAAYDAAAAQESAGTEGQTAAPPAVLAEPQQPAAGTGPARQAKPKKPAKPAPVAEVPKEEKTEEERPAAPVAEPAAEAAPAAASSPNLYRASNGKTYILDAKGAVVREATAEEAAQPAAPVEPVAEAKAEAEPKAEPISVTMENGETAVLTPDPDGFKVTVKGVDGRDQASLGLARTREAADKYIRQYLKTLPKEPAKNDGEVELRSQEEEPAAPVEQPPAIPERVMAEVEKSRSQLPDGYRMEVYAYDYGGRPGYAIDLYRPGEAEPFQRGINYSGHAEALRIAKRDLEVRTADAKAAEAERTTDAPPRTTAPEEPSAKPKGEAGDRRLSDYQGLTIGGKEEVKAAFLKDARGYLGAVAKIMRTAGFEPNPDGKGRPGKAVYANEAGPAVSGEVSIGMRHPDGRAFWAQISETAGIPGFRENVLIVARKASENRYGDRDSSNQWMPPTLTASELAERLMQIAEGKILPIGARGILKPLGEQKPAEVAQEPTAPAPEPAAPPPAAAQAEATPTSVMALPIGMPTLESAVRWIKSQPNIAWYDTTGSFKGVPRTTPLEELTDEQIATLFEAAPETMGLRHPQLVLMTEDPRARGLEPGGRYFVVPALDSVMGILGRAPMPTRGQTIDKLYAVIRPKLPGPAGVLPWRWDLRVMQMAGQVLDAIEAHSRPAIVAKNTLHPDNKALRALFQQATGVKLPGTVKGTAEALAKAPFTLAAEFQAEAVEAPKPAAPAQPEAPPAQPAAPEAQPPAAEASNPPAQVETGPVVPLSDDRVAELLGWVSRPFDAIDDVFDNKGQRAFYVDRNGRLHLVTDIDGHEGAIVVLSEKLGRTDRDADLMRTMGELGVATITAFTPRQPTTMVNSMGVAYHPELGLTEPQARTLLLLAKRAGLTNETVSAGPMLDTMEGLGGTKGFASIRNAVRGIDPDRLLAATPTEEPATPPPPPATPAEKIKAAVAALGDALAEAVAPQSATVPEDAQEAQGDATTTTEQAPGDAGGGDAGQGAEAAPAAESAGPARTGARGARGTRGGRRAGADREPGQPVQPVDAAAEPAPGPADDAAGDGGRVGSGVGSRKRVPDRPVEDTRPPNYSAAPNAIEREGSWRDTAERNLDIIDLVNRLDAEGRPATPEEQQLLAKWTGWGASEIRNHIFRTGLVERVPGQPTRLNPARAYDPNWKPLIERAAKLIQGEDLDLALQSTQYAHYTSEPVIRAMWKAMERFGFKGGRILEPGMGIGLFPVLAPPNVMAASKYTGIELEPFTAKVAKYLLPRENVMRADFTRQKLPDGYFDVAIGNPPFAKVQILSDPAYKAQRFSLHDYFFAKALDKVRPGGVLMFITSRYSMDKLDQKARQYLADRADLVGAIRLPNTAFKANAGTEVVTDIIILRRRAPGEPASGESWTGTQEVAVGDQTVMLNEYFARNPEMVLGQAAMEGTMYRERDYTVKPAEGSSLFVQLLGAIAKLPKDIYSAERTQGTRKDQQTRDIARDWNVGGQKEGGVYLKDGEPMIVENGTGVPLDSVMKLSARERAFMTGWVGLRGALKEAQRAQLDDAADWEPKLKALNKAYDAFVKAHGPILAYSTRVTEKKNADGAVQKTESRVYKNDRLLMADVEGSLASALEQITDDGEIQKGAFLKGRTLKKPVAPEINTTGDALAVSFNDRGRLDLDYIAQLRGITREEAIRDLGDLVYEVPGGEWQTADEYLSGDVLTKLEEAKVAADDDPRYERNVQALLKVQPDPLTERDIVAKLGAGWIPPEVVQAFAQEVLGEKTTIQHQPRAGFWDVQRNGWSGRDAGGQYSTDRRSALELLDALLNNREIKVTDTIKDGKSEKQVVNQAETVAANEKAKLIAEKFRGWVWTDADRARQLLDIYNRRFNNLAPRRFDGSYLQLPGLAAHFKPHPHQRRAVARVLQTGNAYLAHAVGAGKTAEMIMSAMEQRRLGLVNKPMFAVPNHMLRQFAGEFLELYPSAKIMVADDKAFHTDNRRRFMAQAALNDLDAVIITHKSLGKLATKPETNRAVVERMIAELEAALDDLGGSVKSKEGRGNRENMPARRRIEAQIEQIKQKFEGRTSDENRDANLTFEDMGVDFLYVDEAHEFRKLDYSTARQVKGIDPSGSQMALDLFIKTRWLEQQRPGRSLVLASGTPVTNTMAELYTVQRYMDEKGLEQDDLIAFDAWASQYGEVATDYELNAAGQYEPVERFARFVNVPELMERIRRFMDVLTSSQLGHLVQRPSVNGGGPRNVVVERSPELQAYMENELQPRLEASRAWKPTFQQPNNPDPVVAIITDGKLAAIDLRYVERSAKNDPNSKLNRMIDEIIRIHHETQDDAFINRRTGKPEPVKGSTQIVFSLIGLGEGVMARRFDARRWIMQRLADAGISASQVAWMQDFNTDAKKAAMFKEMREGKKRLLIGSPRNMGTGVNIQKRLKALHYLSPPWYPSDVEQPHGRIIRQGNDHTNVDIQWYATKGTYDSTAWGLVARKSTFIEQALTGDRSARVIDDVSEMSQYQMASALAAGDDRVIKVAQLGNEIRRLELLEEAHSDNQRSMRYRLRQAEASVRDQAALIKEGLELEPTLPPRGEYEFTTTKGEKLSRPKEIGEALMPKVATILQNWKPDGKNDAAVFPLGSFFGLPAEVRLRAGTWRVDGQDRIWTDATIRLRVGKRIADIIDGTLAKWDGTAENVINPTTIGTRMAEAVAKGWEMRPKAERARAEAQAEIQDLSKRVDTPFEGAQELAEKIAEQKRLLDDLAGTGEAMPEDRGLPVRDEIEDWSQALEEQRWENEGGPAIGQREEEVAFAAPAGWDVADAALVREPPPSDVAFAPGEAVAVRRLTPAAEAKRADIIAKARALAKRMNPSVDIELVDALWGRGEGVAASIGQRQDGAVGMGGAYHHDRGLIRVALGMNSDESVLALTAHEAWHSVERLLGPGEQALLNRTFPASDGRSQTETIAYKFQDWAADRLRSGSMPARSIFAKAKRFLRSLGNMLRGFGFRTVEDVFEAAEGGEIAARQPAAAEGGASFAALPSFIAPPPAGPAETIARNIRAGILEPAARKRFMTRLAQEMVNRLEPLKEAEVRLFGETLPADQSAWKIAEMAIQDTGRYEMLLRLGPPVVDRATGRLSWDQGIGGLKDVFNELQGPEDYADFQRFMYATRAERLARENRERLMSPADIAAGLALRNDRFERMRQRWLRFNTKLLQFAVDTGTLSPAAKQAYEAHMDYVPFFRVYEETGDILGPRELRQGLSNPSLRIERLKGGAYQLNDLFENISRNAKVITSAGLRNVAMGRIHKLLQELEEVDEIDGDAAKGDRAVSYYVNGERRWFRPHDHAMFVALAGMRPEQTNGIVRILNLFSRIYRTSITATPAFMLRNLIRGSVAGYVQTGSNLSGQYNTLTGFRAALKGSADVDAIKAMTGMGGYGFGDERVLGGASLRRVTGAEGKGLFQKLTDFWAKWEAVGEATEFADRLAIYKNLQTKGVSDMEAAYQAMNLINYSRHGNSAALRFLTMTVPFLNARIQGLYRLGETQASGANRARILRQIIGRGILLSMASVGLWAWTNMDDEDRRRYDEEPLERKMTYWIVYAGDTKLLIPKPFEIGHIFATMPEAVLNAVSKDNGGKDLAAQAGMMLFSTIGFDTYLPIPQAVLPLIEVGANYDFFRNKAIENTAAQRLPPEMRTGPGVSMATNVLGELTGQSPLKLQHLIDGYGGGLAAIMLATVDSFAGMFGMVPERADGVFGDGIAGKAADVLGLTGMVKSAEANNWSRWVEDFYTAKEEANQAWAAVRENMLAGNIEEARNLAEKSKAKLAMREVINRADRRLAEIGKDIRLTYRDRALSGEERTTRLEPLIAERNRIAESVMRLINRMEADQ